MSKYTLYANNSPEIKEIKTSLLEKGVEVDHKYTSSGKLLLMQKT